MSGRAWQQVSSAHELFEAHPINASEKCPEAPQEPDPVTIAAGLHTTCVVTADLLVGFHDVLVILLCGKVSLEPIFGERP